jgi:hypothetical protein
VHKLPAKWQSPLWRSPKCVMCVCIFVLKGHTSQHIVSIGRAPDSTVIGRSGTDSFWLVVNAVVPYPRRQYILSVTKARDFINMPRNYAEKIIIQRDKLTAINILIICHLIVWTGELNVLNIV